MAKLWKRYTDELYTGLNYLASWPPSGRAEVGDVATFQDRSLERYVSIGELGIETTTLTGTAVCERGWASAETNVINPSVAGAAPLQPGLDAGAELTIQFGAEHAILMRAERTREESLDRLDRVKRELLRLHDKGIWKREWVLVTHSIRAERLIALISSSREASAKLRLSAGVAEDAGALASVRGRVKVTHATGMAYEELGAEDATPLYQAVRVQERVVRDDRVKRVGKRGRARPDEGRFEVTEVAF
ncbi:MAG TPA: hypothetical protein VKC63_08320 [Solirubrobacterales bacterium]|nr:hypothetical protein [Solirubrobacterales bacterium]